MIKMIAALTALFVSCAAAGEAVAQTTERLHKAEPHRHDEREQRKNPVPMNGQSVREGRELYGKHCIACHGQSAKGGIGPDLADQVWIHGSSDGEIFQVITDGVTGTAMRGFKEELTEEMRWHLVNYLKSL
jgi:mono/diheme cytochrome c family protein